MEIYHYSRIIPFIIFRKSTFPQIPPVKQINEYNREYQRNRVIYIREIYIRNLRIEESDFTNYMKIYKSHYFCFLEIDTGNKEDGK